MPETEEGRDAGDASVPGVPSDAQTNSTAESTEVDELSVTLGRDAASVESEASVSATDAASTPTSEPLDTGANSSADAGGSATGDTTVDVTASGTTSDETGNLSTGGASDAAVDASTATDAGTDTDAAPDASPSCVPLSEVESDCANNVDEDCDGLLGCEDVDDCGAVEVCQPGCMASGDTELTCDDEEDEDCDGFKDCEDTDCALDSNCLVACVPATEDCSDGEDNDCDGFEDCADSACAATAGCCVGEDAEVCDDGIDNNCDGVLDCPVILSTVPSRPASDRADWEGGAVSVDKATLHLDTPAQQDYVVQCRSGKPAAVSSQQFVVCDSSNPASLSAKPFALVEGPNEAHDGLMTTQVRFAYPNGQVSQPASFTYYVHSSLFGADECVPKAEDAAFFAAAETYLVSDDAATFNDEDARLAAPFVNIAFTPMAMSNVNFEVAEGEGAVEYLSLRRRFVLNADKNLILMKRVFTSRRNPSDDCRAATIRKHDSDHGLLMRQYYREACDAVVLNREGAGVCLTVDEASNISIANPNSEYWQLNFGGLVNWAQADNFMWRKLWSQPGGTKKVFSPKCYAGGSACADGNETMLYLPDNGLFDP